MGPPRRFPLAVLAVAVLALIAPAPAVAFDAPDPGGDEHADVPVPPGNRLLGFNEEAVAGADGTSRGLTPAQHVGLVRTAGANAVRVSLDWRAVEPTRDGGTDRHWERYRVLYEAARSRGVTPIFTLGFAPWWARTLGLHTFCDCEVPPARSMDHEWAEYAAEAGRRFPDAIFEIWNEPNLPASWETGPDPQRFAELQALAYDAIKAEDPSTRVLAGGFSNLQASRSSPALSLSLSLSGIPMRDFIRRAYAARPSIKGHMDALSFHLFDTVELGAGTLFAKSFADARVPRDAASDAATPLFVTEAGVSVGSRTGITAAQQADALTRIYRKTMTMPDVEGIVFHRLIELDGRPANRWGAGFGWLLPGTPPLEPRLVYCAFAAAAGTAYPRCP